VWKPRIDFRLFWIRKALHPQQTPRRGGAYRTRTDLLLRVGLLRLVAGSSRRWNRTITIAGMSCIDAQHGLPFRVSCIGRPVLRRRGEREL
jgi:hypothetical protein